MGISRDMPLSARPADDLQERRRRRFFAASIGKYRECLGCGILRWGKRVIENKNREIGALYIRLTVI